MHRRESKLVKSHGRAYSVAHLGEIAMLPGREEFDEDIKVLQHKIGDKNGKIGVVQKDGIVYASKTIPTPTIAHQKDVLEEWKLVRDLKLLGYHELYNDLQNKQMIIIQDYLPCNLLQYILNQKKYKPSHSKISKHYRKTSKSDLLYPRLLEREAKQIALSVLYKIKKMHKCGFVHCDIKPENIMKVTAVNKSKGNKLDFNCNDWRVIDFGLRIKYNLSKGYSCNSWRGTIGWTPPELVPNNGCNNRIYPELDVWCMGLVILYMIVGENPFELTIKECKENKLYSLESGKKYWYYNKLLEFNNNKKWNHYLIFLHKKNKISLNLLDLLLNHMLVFDVKKRSSIKTVLKHQWFRDILKIQKINQQKKFVIGK